MLNLKVHALRLHIRVHTFVSNLTGSCGHPRPWLGTSRATDHGSVVSKKMLTEKMLTENADKLPLLFVLLAQSISPRGLDTFTKINI